MHNSVVEAKRKTLLLNLKQFISNDELTQETVAIGAGIRPNNASRILQGRYSVKFDTVIALAEAAGYELQLVKKSSRDKKGNQDQN